MCIYVYVCIYIYIYKESAPGTPSLSAKLVPAEMR